MFKLQYGTGKRLDIYCTTAGKHAKFGIEQKKSTKSTV